MMARELFLVIRVLTHVLKRHFPQARAVRQSRLPSGALLEKAAGAVSGVRQEMGEVEMTRKFRYSVSALVVVIAGGAFVGAALAQNTDTAPAAKEQSTPPAANEPSNPSSDQSATPSGQNAQPAGQAAGTEKLPDVQVIQEPVKPKVVPKRIVQKPKKKPVPAAISQPIATPPGPPENEAVGFDEPNNIKMSPVVGSELPKDKVPGGVSTVSASEIASSGSVVPQDYLAQHVPGITVSDVQGNGFQSDIQYRGFESSPVNGVPQGLAVYQNGVRINEAFGDVVNFDFLPEMAIQSATVISGDPAFGLNALGGALIFDMKNGFNYHGAEFDFRAGSFGRIQESAQGGIQSGNVAAYIAIEHIDDGGWREFSATEINRTFADIGFRGTGSEFHLNFSGADNSYGVTAAAPEELLDAGWNRAFTSPQITDNRMAMVSLNGSVVVAPTLTLSGVGYYRRFTQKHIDGNIAEFEACDPLGPNPGQLCSEEGGVEEPLEGPGGAPVLDPGGELGSIDATAQKADSWGGSVQAVDKSRLLGFKNQFLVGASYDHGNVAYSANSTPGVFLPHFVVDSTGFSPLEGPDDFEPRNIGVTNDYVGIYVSNTTDITDRLSVTLGGRYNYARIELENKNNPNDPTDELNSTNTYERFNPAAGATYKLLPGITLYGGYSEANRAPTPAELACADPDDPCLIESFLTADPPLKQVVSHTWELGLRGDFGDRRNHFEWSAGLFRALNSDDIVTQIANDGTRGFFINAADTLRQGLEASASYTTERYRVYASYNYIDATFRDAYEQFSPNNPNAGACSDPAITDPVCLQVQKGDTLPGVPRHKFKAGFDYWLTPQWKFGADVFASAGQYFYGDENNSNAKLAGYAKVNLHTSYDVTENVQVYGLIDNLFDTHFGTYGTFFDPDEASEASLGEFDFTLSGNQRTITPSQPFAAYGGIKVKF